MSNAKIRSLRDALRLHSVPPLNWYVLLAEDDRSDWAVIHRFHALQTWNRTAGVRKKTWLLLATALWPVAAVVQALHWSHRAGRVIEQQTGIPRRQQFAEQVRLSLSECISPKAYYMFRLFEPANRSRADRFLHRYESKSPARLFSAISRGSRCASNLLGDKLMFHDHCVEVGTPTPRVYFEIGSGEECDSDLPACDLFVKPRRGRGGKGTQLWRYTSSGDYEDANHLRMTSRELLEQLRRDAEQRPLLVQERLSNHVDVDLFCGPAFSTARIMTVFNESGLPEPVAAVFRMGVGGAIVDNIHRGGIAAGVDLETGALGSAAALDVAVVRIEVHPDTHQRFVGRCLPDWSKALALVVNAHRHLAGRCVVGWDVGFTDEGPVLVEGNSSPCVNLLQRGLGEPLGNSRFAELLAYHLRHR